MQQVITLENALDIWLIDCSSRNLSKATIRFYSQNLKLFFQYLEIKNLHELTPQHIRQYFISLRERGLAAHSQHDYARAIRAFCNFCVAEELVIISPFRNVKMPKKDKKILPAFTADDIKRILKACNDERDKTAIYFLLDSGVRIGEFVRLNIGDVDGATVKIHSGKGNKDRVIFIGNKTRKQLAKYLILRGKAEANDPLFTTHKNTRFTIEGFQMLMKRLKAKTKIEYLSAHTFRRTFAINCLRNGMNIYVLAKLMGHTDITVLRQYLFLVEDDLKQAHSKHSPVDNIF